MSPRKKGDLTSRTMSTPIEIATEPTKEIWTDKLKILNTLLDKKEFNNLNVYLKPFLEALVNGQENADKIPLNVYLDRTKQDKLAKICIRVIDCQQSNGQARFYAVKILAILVKQLSREPDTSTRATLKLAYELLVKKLQPPKDHAAPGADYHSIEDEVKLKGLSAYCLNQINLKHILTPEEAHRLIKRVILPSACWCLTMETKHEKSTFKVFEDGFHGLGYKNSGNVLNRDSLHTYPLVIQLLVTLMKHSTASLMEALRIELDSILDEARKAGKVEHEHVVALNAIIAESAYAIKKIDHLKEISIDLMVKSEGIHRAHLAFLTCKLFGMSTNSEGAHEELFAKTMIDDLITNCDELLAEIALHSLYILRKHNFDCIKFTEGKTILILKKLLEINPRLEVSYMILKTFRCIRDPESIEFDERARISISQNINRLDQLLGVKERDKEQEGQLEQCLLCLAQLLRLRRHRLEETEEIKLNQLFDLLIGAGVVTDKRDPVFLLIFANSYQVYPSVWIIIIKSLRLAAKHPRERKKSISKFIDNPFTTNKMLTHFLMIDGENFFVKFSSIDVIELIYEYCIKYSQITGTKSLLKEILLTWPEDFKKTRMSEMEHRIMLNKFIKLLVNQLIALYDDYFDLTSEQWLDRSLFWLKHGSSLGLPNPDAQRDQYVDLLSALVVAFCRHREILYRMLIFSGPIISFGSWLKDHILNWTTSIIDHDEYHDSASEPGYMMVELASVVIAHESFFTINEEFHDDPEFEDELKRLLDFIELLSSLGIKESPVDSIVTRRYQQIQASFATN